MAISMRSVSNKFVGIYRPLASTSVSAARTYFTYVNEPAQPIKGKEPKWVTAEEAFQDLKSGNTVFAQGAAATPIDLLTAMTKVGKQKNLKDITVCHMHTEGPAAYTDPSCSGIFRYGVKEISVKDENIFIQLSYSPRAITPKRKFGNLPVRCMKTKIENNEEFKILGKVVWRYRYLFNLLDEENDPNRPMVASSSGLSSSSSPIDGVRRKLVYPESDGDD